MHTQKNDLKNVSYIEKPSDKFLLMTEYDFKGKFGTLFSLKNDNEHVGTYFK